MRVRLATPMTTRPPPDRVPSRRSAALAGLAAGAAALGGAELLAGILPGAASPIIAVGDLVIALQPPGAKQFVVDLFGEADKLILNLLIVAVAIAARRCSGSWRGPGPDLARIGFAGGGLLALGAGLRDPLSEPVTTLLVAGAAVGIAIGVLSWLLGLAADAGCAARARRCRPGAAGASSAPRSPSSAWRRRAACVGRGLLDRGRLIASTQAGAIPAPEATAAAAPGGFIARGRGHQLRS